MRTISSCEVNKGELSKLPGPSSTTSTNDQNPYDSTVRMPRTIRGLSRSSFMTHSSIVTPYSVAEHVWSLKDIRKMILSYCAKDDLSRVICVSKESFVDTMRMLYTELLYEDYRHVERACHEPYRLRQYTHAIRHVDLSNTEGGAIGLNIRLFNRLPRLRSICDGFDRLVLHDDNTSHNICAGFQTTKATLYETFDCGPDSTGEGLLRDPIEYLPASWSISRHVTYIAVHGNQAKNLRRSIEAFFENWIYSRGLFVCPVDKINMNFSIDSQYFLDKIRKLKEVKSSAMPKELMVALNESKSGPSLMTLVEELCTLVENVTMTTQSFPYTTIHDFFSSPIQWPKTTKIKRLEVQLRAEELDIPTNSPNTKLDNFASIKNGGLEYFCMIFNAGGSPCHIHPVSKLIKSLPAFSQIAAGMLKVGGPGCEYALKVTGTLYGESKEQEMGEMLTTLLRREMMEIWKQQPHLVGWRRLTREERV